MRTPTFQVFWILIFSLMFLSGCKNPLSEGSKITPEFLPGLSDETTTIPVGAKLVLQTQPSLTVSGANISSIQLQLQDDNGVLLPVTGVPVTVSFNANPGSGILYGTQTKNSVNGVVQFDDLKIDKAATGYKFIFSSSGYQSIATSSFTIVAGNPSATTSTLTADVTSVLANNSTLITLTATLKDVNSNPVMGTSVLLAATGTGNTIVQPIGTTNISGQITATIKSSVAEAKTISISTPAGFSSVSTTVNFANQILAITAQPSATTAGSSLGSITVQLQDQSGTLIPTSGVSITASFNTNPGSAGTLSGTLTQNTVNGVALFTDLNVDKAASGYRINFAASTYTSAISSSFDITAGVPSSTTSTLTASAATALADGIAALTLTVAIKDVYSNPISGSTVTIASTGTGNTITQPSTTTNASGQTTATIKSTVVETKTISINAPTGLTSVTAAVSFTALTGFTQVWSLDSTLASNYTLSSSGIAFTASNLAHKSLTIDQDNDSSYGFGASTSQTETVWNTSDVELTSAGITAGTGTFISRIFTSPVNTDWTGLNWISKIAAGKALPSNKGIETGYSQYNIDMTGNVLLLHMDESTWSAAAGQVIDSSGSGINGTAFGSVVTTASNGGKYDRAADLTTNGKYITFPHAASLDGTTAISVEAWFYQTAQDTSPRGLVSNRNGTTSTAYSMFFFTNKHLFVDVSGSSGGFRVDTGYIPTLNTWNHVAIAFDGSLSTNRLKVYVNGALFYQTNPGSGNTSIPSIAAAFTTVGSLSGNTSTTFLGLIDEVAIYRRALTATEISNRYNRGIQRIKFQARACDMANCSDQNFVGPGASTTDYFLETLNTGITAKTSVALSGMTNKKYFQYKAVLESVDNVATPKLSSVEVKPDLYDTGYPTVTNNTGMSYKTLTGFAASYAGAGEIRYQISNGTSWYYWTGTTWATASGFGQTNTAAEINSNIASFPIQLGAYGTFSFKAFFNSGTNATNAASLLTVTLTGGN